MKVNNAILNMNPELDSKKLSEIFSVYCSKVLYGKRTPKDAAIEMYDEIKAIYK